jgi:hypothetical protein
MRKPAMVPVQMDSFGEFMPTDQDTYFISEDRIRGGGRGSIFEAQAVQAKLLLTNAVHQLNARKGGRRVPETFEAEHRVRSGLGVAMVLLDQVIDIFRASNLRVSRQQTLGLHLAHGAMLGRIVIERDGLRRLALTLDDLRKDALAAFTSRFERSTKSTVWPARSTAR